MADPGGAEPRRCLLSHYRSLDPRALAAVKALRDHYVSDAQTSSPGDSGPDRLQLVHPGSSRKSLRPRRRRPQTRRPHSSGCHEAGVIFNLLRLRSSGIRGSAGLWLRVQLFVVLWSRRGCSQWALKLRGLCRRWMDLDGLCWVPEVQVFFQKPEPAHLAKAPPHTGFPSLGHPLAEDLTVGCTLVLVLMTMVLTRTGAVSVPMPLLGTRNCHMAQFKSLSPQEMKVFKRAKDALVKSLSLKNWSCSSRPFPRTRDLSWESQVWERPVAFEAELSLTLKVLGTVANLTPGNILDQPLHTLRHIHTKLQACVPAQSTAGPRPQGHLRHWLHRLHEAQKKESPDCLKASVTFNPFCLLTHDLKCATSGDPETHQ
ncbi:LOW QUALITY PROTEIN: interferon lambda-3-like [Saccopteryx bilineata]|uniref:LOW QUALITY PROTEIN: interferon lambda-3-like n=1 Tax=Saccopteryx bilineata TaxID=59482 RepID=UPI00338D3E59